MNEFDMTFNDVMNEIFDSGAEYIREDWNGDPNIVITEYNGEIVLYNKGRNISIGSYGITQTALKLKYKRVQNLSKKDLKSGMIVKLRYGQYRILINFSEQDANNLLLLSFLNEDRIWESLNTYNDDLKHGLYPNKDIIEIFTNITPATFCACMQSKNSENLEGILYFGNDIKKISITR